MLSVRIAVLTCLMAFAASASAAEAPVRIVGSTYLEPFVRRVAEQLVAAKVIAPPDFLFRGTTPGLHAFCKSAAADTPSVAAMSRRMRSQELEECQSRQVGDIIEIQFGYGALVLANRRSDPDMALTLNAVYGAIAHEVPLDDELVPNPNRTWHDVDDRLPALPIRFALAAEGLGARGFFEDRFLQGACRDIPQIRRIFSAEFRVKQCVGLRRDGVLVEIGIPFLENARKTMAEAAPGTVAVLPSNVASSLGDLVKVLPLDGVMPSAETIASRDYPFVRPLFVYVKRAHVRDHRGSGPIAGLRELITEFTSEEAIGPDGYLAREGLMAQDARQREAVRRQARRLTAMER
ncbi:MAG: PstS family phosphate ABC transporter substrate-binding protein [Alphaproteobacteria bacterium]